MYGLSAIDVRFRLILGYNDLGKNVCVVKIKRGTGTIGSGSALCLLTVDKQRALHVSIHLQVVIPYSTPTRTGATYGSWKLEGMESSASLLLRDVRAWATGISSLISCARSLSFIRYSLSQGEVRAGCKSKQ